MNFRVCVKVELSHSLSISLPFLCSLSTAFYLTSEQLTRINVIWKMDIRLWMKEICLYCFRGSVPADAHHAQSLTQRATQPFRFSKIHIRVALPLWETIHFNFNLSEAMWHQYSLSGPIDFIERKITLQNYVSNDSQQSNSAWSPEKFPETVSGQLVNCIISVWQTACYSYYNLPGRCVTAEHATGFMRALHIREWLQFNSNSCTMRINIIQKLLVPVTVNKTIIIRYFVMVESKIKCWMR